MNQAGMAAFYGFIGINSSKKRIKNSLLSMPDYEKYYNKIVFECGPGKPWVPAGKKGIPHDENQKRSLAKPQRTQRRPSRICF
jgi:hypothetical protein